MGASKNFDIPLKTKETDSKKRVAIMQLTRIGDIIQTTQAAQALREFNENIELIFIGRKKFAEGLLFLLNKTFDHVFLIDINQTISNSKDNTLVSLVKSLNAEIEEINKLQIDVMVNLSFSKTSSYLANLIQSKHKLGVHADQQLNQVVQDYWSQYIYSNVMGDNLSSFNLIDIYKSILGVPQDFIESRFKQQINFLDLKKQIICHPFSSLSKKSWDTKKWTEIVYSALKENPQHKIILVGHGESEEKTVLDIINAPILKQFQNRIENKVGTLKIEELYSLINESQLTLGHDSMVMNLASLTSTKVICLALGTVRPVETAPYSPQSIVLSPRTNCFPCFPDDKCDYYQCHKDIPYKVVNTVLNLTIKSIELTNDVMVKELSMFHLSSVKISIVKFSEIGFLYLDNILDSDLDTRDIVRTINRVGWLYNFTEKEERVDFPKLTKTTYPALVNQLKGIQQLYELSEFGKKYSKFILSEISSNTPDINKIKGYSNRIDEIDKLQQLVKQAHPLLNPIINYFTVVKANIAGSNIVEMTENLFVSYCEYSNLLSVNYELIEATLSEHKMLSERNLTQRK